MKANEMNIAIDNVANRFEEGTTIIYLGCEIKVIRKQEPFKYVTNNGKQATKSARYWATVSYPDGTQEDFKSARGGAIARACGLYVRYERDDRNKLGEYHEIINRRIKED